LWCVSNRPTPPEKPGRGERGLRLALAIAQVVLVAADERLAVGEPVAANQVRQGELELSQRPHVAAVVGASDDAPADRQDRRREHRLPGTLVHRVRPL
jgi:hypothetical protein